MHDEDFRDYKYGVNRKFAFVEDDDVNMRKLKYIFRELLIDLGLGKFDKLSLLTSFVAIVFSLWSRVYIHYGAQYVVLKWALLPITDVSIGWYRVDIVYSYWNPFQEVLAVFSGPLGVTLFFGILILITWISN